MSSSSERPALRRLAHLAGVGLLVTAGTATAADFDGSKNLICAPVEVNDCTPVDGCAKTVPSEVGAPAFIRIDFAQQAMVGPERVSPIKLTERTERQMLIMGTELGFGWTVALDQVTGEMTVTMTNGEGSFVFFGSCTPL